MVLRDKTKTKRASKKTKKEDYEEIKFKIGDRCIHTIRNIYEPEKASHKTGQRPEFMSFPCVVIPVKNKKRHPMKTVRVKFENGIEKIVMPETLRLVENV